MTSFLLKIIGIFTMLCDHTSDAILKKFSILNLIGRIAFPLFAFQLTQSYIHTKNLKKFMCRLLIFALIAQIPFTLFLSTFASIYDTIEIFSLNIGFTLLLAVFAIMAFDKIKNKFIGLCVSMLVVCLAEFLNVDYGAFGVLLILIFYIFRDKKLLFNILSIILVSCFYFVRCSITSFSTSIIIFTCIPLIFINLYNGKQGPKVKYLFYIFYPLHLLILYLLK